MSEADVNGISARLWRLPKQLLLALINATAILVIVAAIVALVAIARINHFAENIVATMTEAVLAKSICHLKTYWLISKRRRKSNGWKRPGDQDRRTPG
jgi:hypothetical protein